MQALLRRSMPFNLQSGTDVIHSFSLQGTAGQAPDDSSRRQLVSVCAGPEHALEVPSQAQSLMGLLFSKAHGDSYYSGLDTTFESLNKQIHELQVERLLPLLLTPSLSTSRDSCW